MPKFQFNSVRVTKYEDIIEADTQEEAERIYSELLADDLTEVSQHFEYPVYALKV